MLITKFKLFLKMVILLKVSASNSTTHRLFQVTLYRRPTAIIEDSSELEYGDWQYNSCYIRGRIVKPLMRRVVKGGQWPHPRGDGAPTFKVVCCHNGHFSRFSRPAGFYISAALSLTGKSPATDRRVD